MKLLDNAKAWLLGIALKKAAVKVINLIVARVVALELNKYGVQVDPETLTVAMLGGLEVFRNWLKVKFNFSFL